MKTYIERHVSQPAYKEVHLTRHFTFGDQIISDRYRGCYLRGGGRVRIILSLKVLIRRLLLCSHLSQFPLLLTRWPFPWCTWNWKAVSHETEYRAIASGNSTKKNLASRSHSLTLLQELPLGSHLFFVHLGCKSHHAPWCPGPLLCHLKGRKHGLTVDGSSKADGRSSVSVQPGVSGRNVHSQRECQFTHLCHLGTFAFLSLWNRDNRINFS